ncbi:MAG: competence/damage-inducible protein A [Alphaproteobacteria bacterium]|nr:MAG: competence/damage-inducible protein A [Alphaproteobacteria bacterium]
MDIATNKTAAVLIIGNEILSGRTKEANLNYIALALAKIGVSLTECRVVRDIEGEIIAAINALRVTYDYVFTTGGIGTTHDDITAACVAKAFDVPLVTNLKALSLLEDRYQSHLGPGARKMAVIPEGADLIENPVTIAPGFYMENVFVMAGVPAIAQAMFDDVVTKITHGKPVISETVTCHLPESYISQGLAQLQDTHPNLDIGSYPRWTATGFDLNLVIRGIDRAHVTAAHEDVKRFVEARTHEFEQLHISQG